MHETMICLLEDARGPRARHPRGDRAAARQGGVMTGSHASSSSPCPPRIEEASCPDDRATSESPLFLSASAKPSLEDARSAPTRAGSRASSRTLRDNGFTVGLAETRDALAILASPAAAPRVVAAAGVARAVLRRRIPTGSASTRSSTPTGAGAACAARCRPSSGTRPRRQSRSAGARSRRAARRAPACPTEVERGDGDDDAPPTGAAAAKAPRAPRALAATDMRHIVDPDEIARTHALAARLARTHARAARPPRAGAPARTAARPAPHHPPQHLATAARRSSSPGGGARIKPLRLVCCSTPPAR